MPENGRNSFLGRKFTRRQALGLAGTFDAGALVGGGAASAREIAASDQTVDFYGEHQAGISNPQQDRLHFAAFDLTTSDVGELRNLMREWTEAAARMCAGRPVGEDNENAFVSPDDTGEAQDHAAGHLTVTFGFGPTLFEKDGEDRFGLAARRPKALEVIPDLPGDNLDPALFGGLCVQACADDPQVAFHAVRNLARIGRGRAVIRWSQLGFGRTSSTSNAQRIPRNLMGFKDGTNNIHAEDEDLMERTSGSMNLRPGCAAEPTSSPAEYGC